MFQDENVCFCSISELLDCNQCVLFDEYEIGMLLPNRSELFALPGNEEL